jgi:hypothetical protein
MTDSVEEACETRVKCYNDMCWDPIEDPAEAARIQNELSDSVRRELHPANGHTANGADALAKSPAHPAKHDAE